MTSSRIRSRETIQQQPWKIFQVLRSGVRMMASAFTGQQSKLQQQQQQTRPIPKIAGQQRATQRLHYLLEKLRSPNTTEEERKIIQNLIRSDPQLMAAFRPGLQHPTRPVPLGAGVAKQQKIAKRVHQLLQKFHSSSTTQQERKIIHNLLRKDPQLMAAFKQVLMMQPQIRRSRPIPLGAGQQKTIQRLPLQLLPAINTPRTTQQQREVFQILMRRINPQLTAVLIKRSLLQQHK